MIILRLEYVIRIYPQCVTPPTIVHLMCGVALFVRASEISMSVAVLGLYMIVLPVTPGECTTVGYP